jgi:hypothetical protein
MSQEILKLSPYRHALSDRFGSLTPLLRKSKQLIVLVKQLQQLCIARLGLYALHNGQLRSLGGGRMPSRLASLITQFGQERGYFLLVLLWVGKVRLLD